ncbi:hypothetical protein BaRGS_00026935, partial [Batillaria attramentaria]
CADGYYGTDCQDNCPHCEGGSACDKVTGHCTSCDSGYQLPLCRNACADGTFGQNCREQCGHCANNQPCDKQDGHCQWCADGWSGDLCKECADGYYGTVCQYTCGHCEGGSACDKLVLTEHSARTVVSSVGTVPTTSHVTSKTDIVSGVLMDGLVCADGTYGQNCGEQCGHCANNQPCDKQDGHCQSCATRWSGDLCKECADGYYGTVCQYTCGHCEGGSACDKLVLTEHSARTVVSSVGTVPTTSHVTSKMDIVSGVLMDGLGTCVKFVRTEPTARTVESSVVTVPTTSHVTSKTDIVRAVPRDGQETCAKNVLMVAMVKVVGTRVDTARTERRVTRAMDIVFRVMEPTRCPSARKNNDCFKIDQMQVDAVKLLSALSLALSLIPEVTSNVKKKTALDYVTLGDATHEAEPASEDLEANYENTRFQRTHDTGPEPGASDSDHYERLQVQRGNQDDVSPYEALSLPAGQQGETPAAKKPTSNSKSANHAQSTRASGENVYENTRFARRK